MKLRINGIALGISVVALLVAVFGSPSVVMNVPLFRQGDSMSTEAMAMRIDSLEQSNVELSAALATTRTNLQLVESAFTLTEEQLVTADSRIGVLEESSTTTDRTLSRFARSLSTTQQILDEAEAEPDDIPVLEDYIYIEMDQINGLPGPHVIVEGANLHLRSGSGATDDLGAALLGLGNLVIGYNELHQNEVRARSGSHNLIVGSAHGYSSFGGFLAGHANEVSAPSSSVSGGTANEASGWASSIAGGQGNLATGDSSSVTGGANNQALAKNASVTGGLGNNAAGWASSVMGGESNLATGESSSVAGGYENQTVAKLSAIAGGLNELLNKEGYTQSGSLVVPP